MEGALNARYRYERGKNSCFLTLLFTTITLNSTSDTGCVGVFPVPSNSAVLSGHQLSSLQFNCVTTWR